MESYFTITDNFKGDVYKDKGSKFISYAFPFKDKSELKNILSRLEEEHFSSRHICYSWRLNDGSFRANDDGEPSGSAGLPIYNQILSSNLYDILVVVVRYFGGTLLGFSGLITAYKSSANNVLSKIEKVEKQIEVLFKLIFSYSQLSMVMNLCKTMSINIISQQQRETCELMVCVGLCLVETFKNKLPHNIKIEEL